MGWASGSRLAQEIVNSIKRNVASGEEKTRKRIYKDVIRAFEAHDCDTLCEVEDEEFQEVLDKENQND